MRPGSDSKITLCPDVPVGANRHGLYLNVKASCCCVLLEDLSYRDDVLPAASHTKFDCNPVGVASFGQQLLGPYWIIWKRGYISVRWMNWAYMVIPTHDTFTVVGQSQDLLAIHAKLERLTNPVIIPGFLIYAHTHDTTLSGWCTDHIRDWIVFQCQEVSKPRLGDNVNVSRLKSGDVSRWLIPRIHEDYLIYVGQWLAIGAVPPVRRICTRFEHYPFASGVLLYDEGARTDRCLEEVAFKGPVVHNLRRIVIQVLRDSDRG